MEADDHQVDKNKVLSTPLYLDISYIIRQTQPILIVPKKKYIFRYNVIISKS
jgi:hypothetical protein